MTTDLLVFAAALFALGPFVLVVLTCFTKIAIVLSLLRHALGVPQVPSERVVSAVALALTLFVMTPTVHAVWSEVEPWITEQAEPARVRDFQAIGSAALDPMLDFARRHAAQEEVARMSALADEVHGEDPNRSEAMTVIPAFVVTELNEAFTIGAMLFIPFVVLDIFIANLLISMGLTALSPTSVSLPLKLGLFVMADGWMLLMRGLSLGYAV